jgi:hypothetical protein
MQENERDLSRVVEQPLADHGDLPRQATGPSAATMKCDLCGEVIGAEPRIGAGGIYCARCCSRSRASTEQGVVALAVVGVYALLAPLFR